MEIAEHFPARAGRVLPGIRSQIIRAAVSVAANIAEGCGRSSTREFRHFIDTSLGSLFEVASHLETAAAAGALDAATHARLSSRIILLRKMLIALRKKLRVDSNT